MSEIVYEVRVAGLVTDDDLAAGEEHLEILGSQLRTVLVGRFAHRDGLLDFLRELRNQGFEVVNVRRLPDRMAAALDRTVLATYEMTVPGELGTRVRKLLDSFHVVLTELHTILRAKTEPDVGLVEIGLILESRGLKIASISSAPEPPQIPLPRDKAESPDSTDDLAEANSH